MKKQEHIFIVGKAEVELPKMKANSVDMVLTSPPFGKIRMPKNWELDLTTIGREFQRILVPGGVIAIQMQDLMIDKVKSLKTYKTIIDWCDTFGFGIFHDFIILREAATSPMYWKHRPRMTHEYMFVLVNRKGGAISPNVYHNEHRIKNGLCQGSILDYTKTTRATAKRVPKKYKEKLNTPFPYPLVKDMILMFSDPKQVVMDAFCGIGTVSEVCAVTGRKSVNIDLQPEAIELAVHNIELTKNKIII